MSRYSGKPTLLNRITAAGLAVSFGITMIPSAFAAPGDVNSVNVGQNINSGTYYNTNDGMTVFKNGDGGLVLNGHVRLLESDLNANPTGNGGTGLFTTTGIFKLSGTIDASGLMSNGVFTGNGGRVIINAPYFYQTGTGNIFANGLSGGGVQINVGAMTMDPGARISAKGFGGNGGTVKISSTEFTNVHEGAIINTSGRVVATYDTNVINIEGGMVNINGILMANAVAAVDPGVEAEAGLDYAGAPNGSDGGTIRLVASGGLDNTCVDCVIDQGVAVGALSIEDSVELKAQKDWILGADLNGSVFLCPTAVLEANGSDSGIPAGNGGVIIENPNNPALARVQLNIVSEESPLNAVAPAGDGGTILIASSRNIHSQGEISANGGNGYSGENPTAGGNGGTVAMSAAKTIFADGTTTIQTNGGNGGNNLIVDSIADSNYDLREVGDGANGGSGGLQAYSYGDSMRIKGKLESNGGNGGYGANAIGESFVDKAFQDNEDQNASAIRHVFGGNGGDGGDGGLIAFSGNGASPSNPILIDNTFGPAEIQADGGLGSHGGSADSLATAFAGEGGNASAIAGAYGGAGGEGGDYGTVVASDPTAMEAEPGYSAKMGKDGTTGVALADAFAVTETISDTDATTYAYANGGTGSSSSAASFQIFAGPTNGLDGSDQSATSLSGGKSVAFTDLDLVPDPTAPTTNNTVEQTQANELLLHNENKILLSNGEPGQTLLSTRLDDAIVRTVDEPTGIEGMYLNPIRNFFVSNVTPDNTLVLDQASPRLGFPADFNTMTVNNIGDIQNSASWYIGDYWNFTNGGHGPRAGSHLALLSQNNIDNYGGLETAGQLSGGSIMLTALDGTLTNHQGAEIATYVYGQPWWNKPTHGGAITMRAGQYIINHGFIGNEAGGNEGAYLPTIGATIFGKAGISILNDGEIIADAQSNGSYSSTFGGNILLKANNGIYNYGLVSASATSGRFVKQVKVLIPEATDGPETNQLALYDDGPMMGASYGGNILMKAGNRVINGEPGHIRADAFNYGGNVVLAAGGNPLTLVPSDDALFDGAIFPQGLTPTQLPSFGTFNTRQAESISNLGSISAHTYMEGGDGNILLAGDQAVYADQNSQFNYYTVGSDSTFLTDATSNGGTLLFAVGEGAAKFAMGCGPAPEPAATITTPINLVNTQLPPGPPVFASAFTGPPPPVTLTVGQLPNPEGGNSPATPVVALANQGPDDDDRNPETPEYQEGEPVAAAGVGEESGGMPGKARDSVRGYW